MLDEPYVDEEMEPNPEWHRITNAIIGAAIEVHRQLGPGHPEAIYQRAMEIELADRGVPFEPQAVVNIHYKGKFVGQERIDLLVEGEVIVELKSVDALAPIHTSQLISYLRAARRKLGLVINFNVRLLKDGIKRVSC